MTGALPAPQFGEWTVDDLPEVNWPRHEIIDGSLHGTPMPHSLHQVAAQLLAQALNAEAPQGLLAVGGVGILRSGPPQRFLVPDVVVVQRSGLGDLAVTADAVRLAVEITSPSTVLMDRGLKAELYAEMGVPAYWVLSPSGESVSYEHASAFSSDGEAWMYKALETFRSSLLD